MNTQINKKDNDVLSAYFNDLKRIPLLTREEEAELAKKAKAGDKVAREKVLKANLRFVIKVAKEYTGRGLELCDLISEGNIGLMTALDHYEAERGYRFISYAVFWIKQAVQKAILDKANAIRMPCSKPYQGFKMQSLDAPIKSDNMDSQTHLSFLRDTKNKTPEEQALHNDLVNIVDAGLDTLKDREKQVLAMRFGLKGSKGDMSLLQVGQILQLSKERVRQIEQHALFKLGKYYSQQEKLAL